MPRPFTVCRRVEFCETDLAGVVHFSNFFRYMEFAEQEFLRSRGLSVAWLEGGQRYGFPRVAAACDYRRPARFEDVLTIAVRVVKLGGKSVTYGFEFTRGGDALASGTTTAVSCRATPAGEFEPVSLPEAFRTRLESETTDRE